MLTQSEALEFVKETAKDKTRYRVAKIFGVSWVTAKNWLSENPNKISYINLGKIEAVKCSEKR